MMQIWQHDKRTDNKIILNCLRKFMRNKIKGVHPLHTANGLPPSVLSGRVSCSSSGDRRVTYLRKSSMVQMWQYDKRIDDNKIILNCVRKFMRNKIKGVH